MTVTRLILIQRDDCFLCDQALEIMALAHVPDFTSRWVDDDAELEAVYGTRVPVLRDDVTGIELDGPFSLEKLLAFLRRINVHEA